MKEDSGNIPYDPYSLPARQPPPGANGPFDGHVAPGDSLARSNVAPHMVPGDPSSRSIPAALPASDADQKPHEQKDAFREIVETVVFVVVLVLLLRSFLAEAFVIPTGSMATTLLGYHREVDCPECGFRFPLNMSKEIDPQDPAREVVTGCVCPNCRLTINATNSNQFPTVRDAQQQAPGG